MVAWFAGHLSVLWLSPEQSPLGLSESQGILPACLAPISVRQASWEMTTTMPLYGGFASTRLPVCVNVRYKTILHCFLYVCGIVLDLFCFLPQSQEREQRNKLFQEEMERLNKIGQEMKQQSEKLKQEMEVKVSRITSRLGQEEKPSEDEIQRRHAASESSDLDDDGPPLGAEEIARRKRILERIVESHQRLMKRSDLKKLVLDWNVSFSWLDVCYVARLHMKRRRSSIPVHDWIKEVVSHENFDNECCPFFDRDFFTR
jgi:hypothetical protein